MKFYIDARCLSDEHFAGVARYTLSVINEILDHGHSVVCISNKKINVDIDHDQFSKKEVLFFRFLPGTLFILFLSFIYVEKDSIFLGTNHTIPILGKFKSIPVIHDFNFQIVPETQKFINNLFQEISIFCSFKRSKAIFFVSKYTRQIALERGHLKNSHTTFILPNMPELLPVSKSVSYKPKKSFIFFTGSLEPRKNLLVLLKLFPELGEKYNLELILAGPPGWKNDNIQSYLVSEGIEDFVTHLGYLPRSDLGWYLKYCAVFCFPSIYEGFGIPQFEALRLGAKVVGSINSELIYHEALNNVFLFDPDIDNLEEVLIKALNSKKLVTNYGGHNFNFDSFLGFINDIR